MIEVQRNVLRTEQVVNLYDRLHFREGKVYVPDLVAKKYGLQGKRLSCREVKELLIKDWNRTSRLFRRYALSDCRCLAVIFLFP